MTKFNELGLAKPILNAISDEGYESPTPIQEGVIPLMMQGKDVVGIAQTGTGKTAAFVLPILEGVYNTQERPRDKCCTALIVAPTRELAAQIVDSVRTYSKHMKASVALVVGGAPAFKQIKAISRGVDIVVATPGRLLDHMGTGAIRLSDTSIVVLDEADQMMDMGFIPAIRDIMKAVRKDRQTLLLSATMPKQIRSLANDFLRDADEVSVAAESTPVDRIDQRVYYVERADKLKSLIDILKKGDVYSAIIFTKTRRGADKVNFQLMKSGLKAGAIHGEKTQKQRERTLREFKSGNIHFLVATDIAARGIDVDGITHVINYELPMQAESYIHRIGRTARAGESGIAISFVDGNQRGELRDIERMLGYGFDIYGDGSMTKLPPRMAGPKPKSKKRKDNRRKESRGKKRHETKRQHITPRGESKERYDGPEFTPEADRAPDGSKVEFKAERPRRDKRGKYQGGSSERTFGDKPKGKFKGKPKGKSGDRFNDDKPRGNQGGRFERDGGDKPRGQQGGRYKGGSSERSFDDKPKGRKPKPVDGKPRKRTAEGKPGGHGASDTPRGRPTGGKRKPSPGERKRNSKYFGKRQKAKTHKK